MDMLSRMKSRITSPYIRRTYHWVRSRLRTMKKDVLEVYRQNHSGVYFDWGIGSAHRGVMEGIHWSVTRTLWKERKFYTALSILSWPVRAVVLARNMTRKHGLRVKERSGLSAGRQFIAQVRLALRHGIAPRAYYLFGLYVEAIAGKAALYVQDHEILPLLRLANGDVDYRVFDDKRRFHAECRRLGLPTIPIIAEFESGSLKQGTGSSGSGLPQADLFAKPALGKCGKGVKVYSYVQPGYYRRDDATLLSEKDLLAELEACSIRTPYILQLRYRSHSGIASLTASALCTCRLITCRTPDGRCEEVINMFKMPSGDCCTDNIATGGIAAPVETESGVLGAAISKDPDAGRMEVHPATGQRIRGFRIPHWQEVVSLCLRAHAAFPAYAYIGWDVAVTERGPLLVEGNLRWGVESMQRAHGPMGQTRFTRSFLRICAERESVQDLSGGDMGDARKAGLGGGVHHEN